MSRRRRCTSEVPRRQHSISTTIAAPTVIGNQPPSTILMELETRKIESIVPKPTTIGIATAGHHFHRPTATR